jgi:hypothetical protein
MRWDCRRHKRNATLSRSGHRTADPDPGLQDRVVPWIAACEGKELGRLVRPERRPAAALLLRCLHTEGPGHLDKTLDFEKAKELQDGGEPGSSGG